ncbi:MAG: tetratricopeptide repeat protein [Bacteroidia bacterium]|nr:tetratricopeptide repeat protein [Bacteroidia bacterium]
MKLKNKFAFLLLLFFSGIFTVKAQQHDEAEKFLNALKTVKHDTSKVKILSTLCDIYRASDTKKALKFGEEGLQLAEKIQFKKGISTSCNNLGNVHYCLGNYDKAIEYFQYSLKIKKELCDEKGMAKSYNNISAVYTDQGDYEKAIENFLNSLKIREHLNDKNGMAECYNNIGIVHFDQGSFDKAIEFFSKSLKAYEEINNKTGIAACLNNIGNIYKEKENYNQAIECNKKSLKIAEEINDRKGEALCYTNLGEIYLKLVKFQQSRDSIGSSYNNALVFFTKSLKIFEELGDKNGIAMVWGNTSFLHIKFAESVAKTGNEKKNHYNEAVVFGLKAHQLAKEINSLPLIHSSAGNLQKAYKGIGNIANALRYAEVFITTNDSMFKEEKTKALAQMEAKYQNEKKQKEIELLEKDQKLQLSEVKSQRQQKYAFIGGFVLMLVLAVVIFKSYRDKRKANILLAEQKHEIEEKNEELNQQNAEIAAQRDEIEAQRDMVIKQRDVIEEIHREQTASIKYAERIQKAVLPGEEYINNILNYELRSTNDELKSQILNWFILFKPKDIVSGDFYWFGKHEKWLFIAVADCTGHGVPGAFMSMLGMSFLQEIIAQEKIQTAGQVLDELRNFIINSLQQKGTSGEQNTSTLLSVKDGMDISFIALDTSSNILQYAGANNPLYIVSSQQEAGGSEISKLPTAAANLPAGRQGCKLLEIKGDKMPVAIYENMKPFTNQVIKVNKGDILYLASDGYEDQFGGPKVKKFLSKNLKELLLVNSHLSMAEQKEILNKTFEDWKRDNEQTDDVTIVGFRI